MSVYFAPNVVSGFTVLDGQQAYDHIGPRRHKRLRPCDRSDNLLPHLEAMARHSTDLVLRRLPLACPYIRHLPVAALHEHACYCYQLWRADICRLEIFRLMKERHSPQTRSGW